MPPSKKTEAPLRRLRNIQVRLNSAEASRVEGDLIRVQETSVVEVKPGAYAKAAILAYPRLRKMEADLRALARDVLTMDRRGARDSEVVARINSLLN